MSNRVVFGKLLTLLLIGTLISVLGAQSVKADTIERKVGVKAGGWVKYTINVTFYSDDPYAQEIWARGLGVFPLDVDSLTLTVENVSGTTITTRHLLHYKNGTEEERVGMGDVNGTGTAFIAANLNPGDTLWPSNPQWINETIYREYLGETREINLVNITRTEQPGYTSFYASYQIYFDRATGAPVEIVFLGDAVQIEGYVYNCSGSSRIVDTNIWDPPITPEFNIIAYAFTFAIATATVSVVCLKQRKKQQP